MKVADAPGANVAKVRMGAAPLRSLVTTTFVSVMSPTFRTVPV